MDAGSLLGAVGGRGVGDRGHRTGRDDDPGSGGTVPGETGGIGRVTGRCRGCLALALVVLAVGGAALVAVAQGSLSPGGGRVGPIAGLLATGVVGLAASSGGDDGIAALTDKVERARAGEEVAFETDRDDGLGELAAAVEGLTEELRDCERERGLRERVVESAPVGVVVADATAPDYPLVAVNERFEELTGYDESECLGRDCRFLQGEGTDEEAVAELRRALEAGEETTVELRNYREDGTGFWNRVRLLPVEDEDGEVTHYVGFQEDVTDRVEREEESERCGSLLDSIFEQLPVHIYAKDREARYVRVNSAFSGTSDCTAEDELYGKTDVEAFDGEFAEDSYEDDRRVIETGESVVDREEYLDHVDEWNLTTKVPWRGDDGEIRGVLGVSRRITERKKRERELEEYREYTEGILDAVDDVFYVFDDEGRIQRWNETLASVTGYSDAEIESMHGTDFFPAGAVDRVVEAVSAVFETGEDRRVEAPVLTKSGEEVPYEFVATRVETPDGDPVLVGVGRDISERKAREREVREANERLNAIIEASPAALVALDFDARVTLWNPAAERIFGWSEQEVLGEPLPIVPEDRREELETVFERAEEGDVVTAEETKRRRKDGTLIDVSRSAAPLRDSDGEVIGTMGALADVTERKETERELRATKERLRKFIGTSPVGVVATDPEGRVTLWNDAMEEIFGWSESEVLGEPYPAVPGDEDDEIRQRVLDGESFAQVELRRVRKDGEVIDVSLSTAPIHGEDGEVTEIVGYVEDITERKERERELERTRDLLQQAGRIAAVGGWELDLTGEEPAMTWTDELYRLHGVSPDTEIDVETAVEFYHPEDRSIIRRYFQQAIEAGESYDMEVRLQPDEGTVRWVRAIGEPVSEDGEVVRVRGSIQDITQQKERELALESLHEATRELLGVETDDEAADLVVDIAHSVLDVAGVAVYLLDDTANQLDAVACSEGFRQLCEAAPVGAGASDSLLWNTYVTGTPTVFDDTQTIAQSQVFGSAVSGGLLVPLGDHGVFVVATRDRAVDQETRRLVETLVATTEAAFDRLASEETLRERDVELEAQNRQLRRQIQITDLLRRIDQSLSQAESREAVETAVCDRLVESGDVAFAWIGALTGGGDRVEPTAWAGDGTEYLDTVSLATDGDNREPAVATAVSEAPTVVGNVVDDLKREAWRKTALSEGFQSVLSVPLAFEEYFYGVLAVYADEPDAFGELEREVFAELGGNIAHSINAVETQRALHTDQRVELTLEFDADDDVLGRLAAAADCQIEFAGLAAHSETETGLFLSVSGAPTERVAAALDELVSVRDYRLVSDADGNGGESADSGGESDGPGALFEVTVDSDTLPARFVRHGARPQSVRASAGGIEAVVDVPTATDVRAFVEMLAETYPSVALTSRRSVERTAGTHGGLASSLFEALTDRQLEVLRTAYFAGFFEWPRTSTGEDVAEMLGVSQPTVNRHLRLGQQRLLEQLFEERAVEIATETG